MSQFLIPNGNEDCTLYSENPRYCFFNNEGTKVHVLITAEIKEDYWAVVLFDIE